MKENKENVEMLINPTEFQELILNYIGSDEFNKMVDNTVFTDDAKYKSAIMHGMCIASMLTSRCNKFYVVPNNEEVNEEEIQEEPKSEFIILDDTIIGIKEEFEESITELNIPREINGNVIKNISSYAFKKCTNLTTVILPDTITRIGSEAFCDCINLTNIHIPEGVTIISDSAFSGCNKLTTVYYTGTEDQWKNIDIAIFNHVLTNTNIVYNYNT